METIPKIKVILDPPTREDSENFDTRADDTMEKLPVWTEEINDVSDSLNILSTEINTAIQQAALSTTSGDAIVWVSGGSTRPFLVGEAIIYTDGLSYRCMIATTAGESPDTNPEKWKNLILSGIKDDPNPTLGGDLGIGEYQIPGLLGAQTIYIPAGAMTARETSGAEPGSVETVINKIMVETLDFDATVNEFAQFSVRMPKSWDAGAVTAQFIWSHGATTTNFGVRFFIQGLALTDDDTIDTAFSTAVAPTADTGGITDNIYFTEMSDPLTLSNAPAKSDLGIFQIYRDVSDTGDTMAVDARLHGIVLIYSTDEHTDA